MSANLLTGKEVAQKIESEIRESIVMLGEKGVTPSLTIVGVGNAPDAITYANRIKKAADKLSIACTIEFLPDTTSQNEFIAILKEKSSNKKIHGIIVLRPLPTHIKEETLKYLIDPGKDIDCFNPINAGKIFEGDLSGFAPATAEAVMEILHFYNIPISGRETVVIGRSMIVGKPLSMLLLKENATITICHSKTESLPAVCKRADILVAAIGKSKMVTKDYIKDNATVIDVGINVDGDSLTGDVNFEQVKDVAGAITPVPGGVGVVTTKILLKHVVKAAMMNKDSFTAKA
ncbi:MAG: bifunctional 5,10-methylenetetrahydrofolate dehydrogenase/5,10-methenyltetrahydrofolate cyclohydrolase [Nitrospirota bacterium]